MNRLALVLALAATIALGATAARADSTPIGALPPGPMTKVETTKGSLVAVALPRQKGLCWRIARPLNARVIRQVSEANVGSSLVLVFRAVGKGHATVRFGLTRGDSSSKAVKSATYDVTAR